MDDFKSLVMGDLRGYGIFTSGARERNDKGDTAS